MSTAEKPVPEPLSSHRHIRVLLFSPVLGLDQESGDLAYTETLLTHPPADVTYTTYAKAFDAGLIRLRGRRPRYGQPTLGDLGLLAVRSMELGLRRVGAMYREPTWYVTIDDSAFDVVHQHLFPVRQVGTRLPVVSSAGYPLPVLYGSREKWNGPRLATATALERAYATVMDVHNPWLRCGAGNVMTSYTEHFRRYLVAKGARVEDVIVCSTGVPDTVPPARRSNGLTLGFIGRDFERKGGDIALGAFNRLQGSYPGLRLRVITTSENVTAHRIRGQGIDVYADVPHAEVLGRHLPEIDILLLPTRSDCGAPYGLLEALRAGVCAVTSRDPWLDERLTPPAVTRVNASVDAVAATTERLLQPDNLSAAQQAAVDLRKEHFSMSVVHEKLLDAYHRAIAGRP